MTIGRTVVDILGGRRALYRIGTPAIGGIAYRDRGVSVRFRGGSKGRNRVSIDLLDDGTYEVRAEQYTAKRWADRHCRMTPETVTVHETITGVRAVDLASIIASVTGVQLSPGIPTSTAPGQRGPA